MQDELDYVEPSGSAEIDEISDEETKLRFKTVKLDASLVEVEFMCELWKKQLHLLCVPMLATCCGHSACFDCFKSYLAESEKNMDTCPFCN